MKERGSIPAEEPVIVFETEKPYEAEIVRGLLENYGIESHIVMMGKNLDLFVPIFNLMDAEPRKIYKVFVDANKKEIARDILASGFEENSESPSLKD